MATTTITTTSSSSRSTESSLMPLALVFLSGFGFSLQSLIIKLLEMDGFNGSFQCVLSRGLVQMLLTAILISRSLILDRSSETKLFGNTRGIFVLLLVRSVIGFGGIAFSFLSVELLPIGDSTVIVMLNAVISSILAVFILGEPWKLPEFVATIISLTGVVFVARPSFIFGGEVAKSPLGIFYAVTAAVTSAGAYITVRMLGTTHKMPWENICFVQGIGQVVLSIPCLYVFGQKLDFHLSSYRAILILCGGVIGALSQVAMTVGMQREKSASATAMRMSDVLFGFIWQLSFTPDAFDAYSILGAIMVTGSIFIIILFKKATSGGAKKRIASDQTQYEMVSLEQSRHGIEETTSFTDEESLEFEMNVSKFEEEEKEILSTEFTAVPEISIL